MKVENIIKDLGDGDMSILEEALAQLPSETICGWLDDTNGGLAARFQDGFIQIYSPSIFRIDVPKEAENVSLTKRGLSFHYKGREYLLELGWKG